MRAIGLILVLTGVLILTYQGFSYVTREPAGEAGPGQAADRVHTVSIPPVVGGIALVTGLLLLATDRGRAARH